MENNKPEGIFKDGSLWFGDKEQDESGVWWFMVGDNDYQTKEIPETFPLFVMTIFPDGTPESFVNEYKLARKIGDSRFGSVCKHERSKRGYCPDCLRKIM